MKKKSHFNAVICLALHYIICCYICIYVILSYFILDLSLHIVWVFLHIKTN